MTIRENRLKWIRDLETTDLPQTKYDLKTKNGYCCLGICQEITMGKPIVLVDDGDYKSIREFLDIASAQTFWDMNDGQGLTFKEIAAKAREMWGL